ncbi:MAG: hypothetical protein GY874_09695 [Desulfobacteraceae bacterium]|nr:hypothetical protein [Desulfobacteraceae bacterium]
MDIWYAPATAKQWFRRLVSLRLILALIIGIVCVCVEFRLNWIEKTVGGYLVQSNSGRPESGAIWDQGRQTHLAQQTLKSYITQRRTSQREARQASSLGQLVLSIDHKDGAMVSAEHFVDLYQKLPPILSNEMISPFTLLTLLSGGHWRRTFFELQDQILMIYLLDNNNQVLHRLSVGKSLLAHIKRGEVAIDSSLDQLADFGRNIYSSEKFFKTLNSFPESVRKGIIAHPEDLLRISGKIIRVGISSSGPANMVDLGFEVETVEGPKVILVQGRQADVDRLLRSMQGASFFDWMNSPGDRP